MKRTAPLAGGCVFQCLPFRTPITGSPAAAPTAAQCRGARHETARNEASTLPPVRNESPEVRCLKLTAEGARARHEPSRPQETEETYPGTWVTR